MSATIAGRRVAYDRVWGSLLFLSGFVAPPGVASEPFAERFLVRGDAVLTTWLVAGTLAGLIAAILGQAGLRGRGRHGLNIAFGLALLAMPLFFPVVWNRFPSAGPDPIPLVAFGRAGTVMLLALGSIYIGAGIRVARPTHFAGLSLGTVGALVVAMFACLPEAVGGSGYASGRIFEFRGIAENWRDLLPVVLVAGAVACSIANMVRNRLEVALARATRLLLVAALMLLILLPTAGGEWYDHLPAAWGSVRFFGPLFLALDGAIAFTAISITRSQE